MTLNEALYCSFLLPQSKYELSIQRCILKTDGIRQSSKLYDFFSRTVKSLKILPPINTSRLVHVKEHQRFKELFVKIISNALCRRNV